MWRRAARPRRSGDRPAHPNGSGRAVGALALYLGASVLLFGLPLLGHLSSRLMGSSIYPDSRFFVWAMRWWPHAVGHGLNPIWTRAVWAPGGYNLAWATGAPGPSLLMTPITLTAGPVVAYNVMGILAPALSAFTGFVLCRHVTGRFWPSLLAGYVFGFSTYEIGHVGVHVNLDLVFLVPLSVYLVLRRVEGTIGPRRFVALMALLLIGQFLISTEIFATMTLLGAVALGTSVLLFPEWRGSLASSAWMIGVAYVIAGLFLIPFLYYALAYTIPRRDLTGSDLVSFFLPRTRTLLGSATFAEVTRSWPGAPTENTAYLGPPLLLVLGHFAWTRWRDRAARLLLALLGVVVVATLGPTLSVNGNDSIPLPWRLVRALPLLDNAAPPRFTLYLFLILAIILAVWLSSRPTAWPRWIVALLIPVFLFPRYSPDYLHAPADVPAFFATGAYRDYLDRDEIVLILPQRHASALPQAESMLMQAQTDFDFRLLIGYTGPQGPDYHTSPILRALYRGRLPSVDPAVFQSFLAAHHVGAVIMERGWAFEHQLTALLDIPPMSVEDVLVFRLSLRVAPGGSTVR